METESRRFWIGFRNGLAISLVLWAAIIWGVARVAQVYRHHVAMQHLLQSDLQSQLQSSKTRLAAMTVEVQSMTKLMERQRSELTVSRTVGLLPTKPGPWKQYVATFYAASGGQDGSGNTKSGLPVERNWTVAADPRLLPLGTLIEVRFSNGKSKFLQVTDVGGAIKGHRLDIYVPTRAQAFDGGRPAVQVRVLLKARQ